MGIPGCLARAFGYACTVGTPQGRRGGSIERCHSNSKANTVAVGLQLYPGLQCSYPVPDITNTREQAFARFAQISHQLSDQGRIVGNRHRSPAGFLRQHGYRARIPGRFARSVASTRIQGSDVCVASGIEAGFRLEPTWGCWAQEKRTPSGTPRASAIRCILRSDGFLEPLSTSQM